MTLLSVCMIVKDEEKVLERCLSSIQNLADEIIIVDTGSTDETKKIASKYTNHIYDFKWCNDFSKARNQSIQPATGKWILVLDADEYISQEDHRDWRNFLIQEEPVPHLAYTLPIINFTGEKEFEDEITTSPVTRLFPNHMGITFERPIHEQLTRGSKGELFHKTLNLHIYHTGYQISHIKDKNKHERNMSIFEQMMLEQDLCSYDWYTLGNQYRYAKNELKAIECYEKAMTGAERDEAWYPHCVMGLISLYYGQDQLKRSWELTEQYLVRYNQFPEYYTVRGIHYETLGFFDEARLSYIEAINIAEKRAKTKQDIWLIDPMYSFDSPVQQLIGLYFRLNDNQNAIYWMSKQLNKNNKNPGYVAKMMEWLLQNEDEESVIRFFEKIYISPSEGDYLLLFKVSLFLGNRVLVNHYKALAPMSMELSPADQLKLSLVDRDLNGMHQLLDKFALISQDEKHVCLQVITGVLMWNDTSLLDKISKKIQNKDVWLSAKTMVDVFLQVEPGNPSIIEMDDLFAVSRQLFLLKEFEVFDQWVNKINNDDLTNKLANYFYDMNHVELAMNYYSALLSGNRLSGMSFENLGFYHANQKYTEDAVEFLNAALLDEPGKRHIYKTFISLALKQDKLRLMKNFKNQFSDFDEISFVREFLDKEIEALNYTV
ncbi:glycosyltransferase family 2 protein [Paenibacillus silvae]|uniref:Glycosyltransferase family 2 protein n=1 Tax=Paenibacillus silvae TaxID=1325358 RepID=A0A2W6NM29_9BACL|nr:glycosyltransferase family 2 protein [Paenibacillus silvae]PZT56952.1 glycosyltransferase family 2 protein [Paenibacillus silvae]